MSGVAVVVIAFIVLANILRLVGKTGGVGQRAGRPRHPELRRYAPGDPRRLPGARAPDPSSAAVTIPDDFWRILMGEARSSPSPVSAPEPAARPAPARFDEEAGADEEAEVAEGRLLEEASSLEEPAGGGLRTIAGGGSVAPSVRPTVPVPVEPPPTAAPRTRVRDLRRAIILREVLGPPKGLE
ncbi:MAG: hypothetical protein IRZ00_00805 [Gemmatimonadetes bacterium]|nr:hypothetical protein [Gemmatimonadota bacterium]